MTRYMIMFWSTVTILLVLHSYGFKMQAGLELQFVGCMLVLWNWLLFIVLKKDRRKWNRR